MCDMWLDPNGQQATAKYQQLLDEAMEVRLARLATAKKASSLQRFTLWLGDVLVNAGETIRRHGLARQAQMRAAISPFESSSGFTI